MPRSASDPDPVRAWLKTIPALTTRAQYGSEVRRFLRQRGSDDVRSVVEAELRDFAAKITEPGRRRKAIAALESFFGYLFEDGVLNKDCARSLARATRRTIEAQTLLTKLKESGVPLRVAQTLSWRDVAAATFPQHPPSRRKSVILRNDARRLLITELLGKLRSVDVDELETILNERVFPLPQ